MRIVAGNFNFEYAREFGKMGRLCRKSGGSALRRFLKAVSVSLGQSFVESRSMELSSAERILGKFCNGRGFTRLYIRFEGEIKFFFFVNRLVYTGIYIYILISRKYFWN